MNPVLTQNLKEARKTLKLTQDKAANKIGIPRHRLGSYEEGRCEPPNRVLIDILEAYNIPLSHIKEFIHNPAYFVDCKNL